MIETPWRNFGLPVTGHHVGDFKQRQGGLLPGRLPALAGPAAPASGVPSAITLPLAMTMMGSHMCMTNCISCSMMTKVISRSTLAVSMLADRSRSRVRLTPAAGSSSRTSLGSAMRVRANSSSFFWPPERLPAYSLARWPRLTKSSTSRAWRSMRRSCRFTSQGRNQDDQMRSPAWGAGTSIRFSRTVMRFISRGIWKVRMRPSPKVWCIFHAVDTAALEENLPAGGRNCAGYQVEQGGFAGAVRPDQARDIAGHDVERTVVNGPHPAEVLHHVPDFQDGRLVSHVCSETIGGMRALASCGDLVPGSWFREVGTRKPEIGPARLPELPGSGA